ncbi:hypothetical protein BJ875DRAFT_439672 [Amylocarpus encephaloides]|uniref:Myb-like DNA-binding domain-containing protein n=1 Tax=Amylocarpus encephaloides TaxID=45428 RepID=A0A9P7YN85_9HELO|nr:hypothetical protein BJ875DRAFT_439672 [Amylocarpus encephaloides]
MAPASNEEQFKFLISCIRYSNNGRVCFAPQPPTVSHALETNIIPLQVDFSKVADECGIISKGAAAKRYERMMRAHGIASNEKTGSKTSTPTKSKADSSSDTASNPAKKRKMIDDFDESGNSSSTGADDDEGFGSVRERRNVKSDPEGRQEFKTEDMAQNLDLSPFGFDGAGDLLKYYDAPTQFDNISTLVDAEYNDSEYDGNMSRFMSPCLDHDHPAFGSSIQQKEDVKYPFTQFSNGLDPVGSNMQYPTLHSFATTPTPRSINQNMAFRPNIQYQADNQGHSESPVLVE